MLLRKIIFTLILLPIANVMAQEATFQSFLNELKECSKVEISYYVDISASDDWQLEGYLARG